jgi:glycosyltransferase involved in cell wall biosynthesis
MKVSLVFTRYRPPHFRGGIERYVDEVGRRLLARGIDCEVVAMAEDLPTDAQVPARYVRVLRGLPYGPVLSFALRARGFWQNSDRVLVQYAQLGLSVPADRLCCVVHTTCAGEAESLARDRNGVRSTLRRHALRTIGAGVERHVLRRARAIVAINDHIRTELVSVYGVAAERIAVIGNGVDCDAFVPRPASAPRAGRVLNVLYVGRLVARKNVGAVVSALARSDPAILCTIVGDGPDRPHLERLARHLDVADRVTFRGFLQGAELASSYQSADLLVMPSSYEGMPMAILEAKASGIPTIAANFQGARALIPETAGIVLDEPLANSLPIAFDLLLDDPAKLRALSEGARNDALERFDWSTVIDRLARHIGIA